MGKETSKKAMGQVSLPFPPCLLLCDVCGLLCAAGSVWHPAGSQPSAMSPSCSACPRPIHWRAHCVVFTVPLIFTVLLYLDCVVHLSISALCCVCSHHCSNNTQPIVGREIHLLITAHSPTCCSLLSDPLVLRGGGLYHRIRSLPYPLNDERLLQLLRQADLVLDTFPIGVSQHALSLALSTGTPVITLRPGTIVATAKDDLQEIRSKASQYAHPLRGLLGHADLPWLPSTSTIAAFLDRHALSNWLVANSTGQYFQLAHDLLSNRELAYEVRVKILEAIDAQCVGGKMDCCPGEDLGR